MDTRSLNDDGMALLPYQQRWIADRSPVKIAVKSRRIGITWATAADAVLEAASVNGQDIWYLGYSEDMAKEFIRDCSEWARFFHVASTREQQVLADGGPSPSILAHSIHFASGYRVTALSSRPTNLRGKAGHVIIDEAAFHGQLDELLKAAMALLMWSGRISIISTPNGVDNAFNRLINDVAAGKRAYSVHRITLDDALHDGLYKRISYIQGIEWSAEAEAKWRTQLFADYGDYAQEELLCVPLNSGGVYINRGLIESAMFEAPVVELALPDEFMHQSDAYRRADIQQWCDDKVLPLLRALPRAQEHYLGVDFGRVNDLSVLCPITLERNMTRSVPFLIELRNVPFLEQAQIVDYVLNKDFGLPRLGKVALDATGNGAFLGERCVQNMGESIAEAIHMSAGWYAENLPKLKAAFEDKTIRIPRDSNVASDLGAFRVIDGAPRLPKLKLVDTNNRTRTRHGDSAIAIALAYYASLQGRAEFVYKPVEPARGAHGTFATMRTKRGAYG